MLQVRHEWDRSVYTGYCDRVFEEGVGKYYCQRYYTDDNTSIQRGGYKQGHDENDLGRRNLQHRILNTLFRFETWWLEVASNHDKYVEQYTRGGVLIKRFPEEVLPALQFNVYNPTTSTYRTVDWDKVSPSQGGDYGKKIKAKVQELTDRTDVYVKGSRDSHTLNAIDIDESKIPDPRKMLLTTWTILNFMQYRFATFYHYYDIQTALGNVAKDACTLVYLTTDKYIMGQFGENMARQGTRTSLDFIMKRMCEFLTSGVYEKLEKDRPHARARAVDQGIHAGAGAGNVDDYGGVDDGYESDSEYPESEADEEEPLTDEQIAALRRDLPPGIIQEQQRTTRQLRGLAEYRQKQLRKKERARAMTAARIAARRK
jgi:hypothetical protein